MTEACLENTLANMDVQLKVVASFVYLRLTYFRKNGNIEKCSKVPKDKCQLRYPRGRHRLWLTSVLSILICRDHRFNPPTITIHRLVCSYTPINICTRWKSKCGEIPYPPSYTEGRLIRTFVNCNLKWIDTYWSSMRNEDASRWKILFSEKSPTLVHG